MVHNVFGCVATIIASHSGYMHALTFADHSPTHAHMMVVTNAMMRSTFSPLLVYFLLLAVLLPNAATAASGAP